MKLVVEISLYPLQQDYIEHIKAFIDRINQYQGLEVQTNATSTIVIGDYEHLMLTLGKEMRRSHEELGQGIFVCKFLNNDKAGITLS